MTHKPATPVIRLPNGSMPALGLGTWQMRGDECTHAVRKALELGYRLIDTAELYRNESEIGKAIAHSGLARQELFITSKVMPNHAAHDEAIEACRHSLERLQTDYLDLYLLHWPGRVPLDETFRAFCKLQDEGKIRSVGVSNFDVQQLRHAMQVAEKEGIQIEVNQVEFHPYLFQEELLAFCQKQGVHVTAYCPVARGIIFDDAVLMQVAKRHKRTVAQVSLAWLLQHGLSVIPKASKESHLRENLDALEFNLTEQDMTEIDAIRTRRRLVPL